MNSIYVIIVKKPVYEVWTGFKKLCLAKGDSELPYLKLRFKKFPIKYNNWVITKAKIH
jgi:hypothetical protein